MVNFANDANVLEMKIWQDNLCLASKSALYFSILKFKSPIVESKTLSSVKWYSFVNNKFYIGYIINQDKKNSTESLILVYKLKMAYY